MNAASSVFDEVGKISYIYIIYYLLADITELLPLDLDTVMRGCPAGSTTQL